jgi:hypothetical protein
MKKRYIKSSIFFLLALSIIITSAIGIPMLEGYAEGVSGDPDPSIQCTTENLNGSYLRAYANAYTADDTYPRLVTNGTQIRARFWGYDSTGITNIKLQLAKIKENNQLVRWDQPGNLSIIYENNISAQNDVVYSDTFTVSSPGTYAVITEITAGNGRKSKDVEFLLYGPGTVVGGDFNTRIARPEGQALYCTLYDLSGDRSTNGTGINTSATSLYVTKPGAPTILSNNGLTITQDPSFPRRYKVFGYANRSQLQNVPGQYQAFLNVYTNAPVTTSTIYYPPYN